MASKISKRLLSSFNTQTYAKLLPVVAVAIVFGGFGLYKLRFSSAGKLTTPTITITGRKTVANINPAPYSTNYTIKNVAMSLADYDSIGFYGNADIIELAPGGKLVFGGRGAGYGFATMPTTVKSRKTCYVISAATTDGLVKLASGSNTLTFTVRMAPSPASNDAYWQEFCVPYTFDSTRGSAQYQVENVGTTTIRYYETHDYIVY